MELKFNEADIGALLLEKARSMGFSGNTVDFDTAYGVIRSATVSFEESKNPPIAPSAPNEVIDDFRHGPIV